MSFNADDYTQPPFTNGIMTLTNDECVKVKDKCQEIKEAYKATSYDPEPSTQYVVSSYNESNNYKEGINGDTYHVIEKYNPEVNTQGISPDAPEGIVPEPEEAPEEPTETPEEPTEGETSPDEENPPNEPETAPADAEETTEEA
jgi:hypothetical protein